MDNRRTDEGKNGIHVKTSHTVHLCKGDIIVQTGVNKPSVTFNSSQALIEQAWLQCHTFPSHDSASWAFTRQAMPPLLH